MDGGGFNSESQVRNCVWKNGLPRLRRPTILTAMKRVDGRAPNQLRPVKIHPHYVKQPAGSALIEMGDTRVLCAASTEDGVPRWMREQRVTGGWITAEYSMLPYATAPRKPRKETRAGSTSSIASWPWASAHPTSVRERWRGRGLQS